MARRKSLNTTSYQRYRMKVKRYIGSAFPEDGPQVVEGMTAEIQKGYAPYHQLWTKVVEKFADRLGALRGVYRGALFAIYKRATKTGGDVRALIQYYGSVGLDPTLLEEMCRYAGLLESAEAKTGV